MSFIPCLLLIFAPPGTPASPKLDHQLAEISGAIRQWRTRLQTLSVFVESRRERTQPIGTAKHTVAWFRACKWTSDGRCWQRNWSVNSTGKMTDWLTISDRKLQWEFSDSGADPLRGPGAVTIRPAEPVGPIYPPLFTASATSPSAK